MESNWFGSPPSDLPITVTRPDRTPAETTQTRCFDEVTHIRATRSNDMVSAPLTNLRPRRERGLRRLAGWLGGVIG